VVIASPSPPDCAILSPILFATGSDALGPASEQIVERTAEVILKHPVLLLSVEGHADRSEGKGARKLSELRAEAVRDALVKLLVPADTLVVKGFAATLPLDTSRTEEARARNRRVEFRILKDGGSE
jgi:outer membrane protein OmpA-like peptidoglycan-associated protein